MANFINKFIEDLGYRKFSYPSLMSVYSDRVGFYHLKMQGYEFQKIDLCLKTKTLDFSPIVGHKISGEVVEFLEALRNADTTQLCKDIDKWKSELYECVKEAAYVDYKKYGHSGDWSKEMKGKILVPFIVDDYGNDSYDLLFDRTGQDLKGTIILGDDYHKAVSEGVLKVWQEMTGRDDLYVYKDDGIGYMICSK